MNDIFFPLDILIIAAIDLCLFCDLNNQIKCNNFNIYLLYLILIDYYIICNNDIFSFP